MLNHSMSVEDLMVVDRHAEQRSFICWSIDDGTSESVRALCTSDGFVLHGLVAIDGVVASSQLLTAEETADKVIQLCDESSLVGCLPDFSDQAATSVDVDPEVLVRAGGVALTRSGEGLKVACDRSSDIEFSVVDRDSAEFLIIAALTPSSLPESVPVTRNVVPSMDGTGTYSLSSESTFFDRYQLAILTAAAYAGEVASSVSPVCFPESVKKVFWRDADSSGAFGVNRSAHHEISFRIVSDGAALATGRVSIASEVDRFIATLKAFPEVSEPRAVVPETGSPGNIWQAVSSSEFAEDLDWTKLAVFEHSDLRIDDDGLIRGETLTGFASSRHGIWMLEPDISGSYVFIPATGEQIQAITNW